MDHERHAHLRILVAAVIVALVAPAAAMAQPAFTVLHAFAFGSDGALPEAALIQAADGNFYGTTLNGGIAAEVGTVFKMTPAGAVTVLHAFSGPLADGMEPSAPLIQATDGNFYGTTGGGGAATVGTVFKMTPAGVVTILHSFTGPDGSAPAAPLIQAADGNFYGTSSGSGSGGANAGTIFKMTPDGAFTVVYSFTGGADGGGPLAALLQVGGNFYGTTVSGGAYNGGTVFKMTPDGTESVLYSFTAGMDGGLPKAALIQATDANFYGTTAGAGGAPPGAPPSGSLRRAP